jgi:hypothetical protein
VDAIHLLGHGSSGSLNLGALTLNTDNLQEQAATLAQIGGALTAQGDWLLYGCNVAEGAAGVSLLGQLAQFSGADVAASSDATGATALGGDWVLEAASGDINASLLDCAGLAPFPSHCQLLTGRQLHQCGCWTHASGSDYVSPVAHCKPSHHGYFFLLY